MRKKSSQSHRIGQLEAPANIQIHGILEFGTTKQESYVLEVKGQLANRR